jgi:hypothetical protein
VEWPVSEVLHASAMATYSAVFRFLLRVRRAGLTLREVRALRENHVTDTSSGPLVCWQKSEGWCQSMSSWVGDTRTAKRLPFGEGSHSSALPPTHSLTHHVDTHHVDTHHTHSPTMLTPTTLTHPPC